MKNNALIGKYFHTFKGDELRWQGQVSAELGEGYFLVQLFDWLVGQPNNMKVVHLGNMTGWNFYDDADYWRQKGDEASRRANRKYERELAEDEKRIEGEQTA